MGEQHGKKHKSRTNEILEKQLELLFEYSKGCTDKAPAVICEVSRAMADIAHAIRED